MTKPILYDYWKSSASYRIRIAMNLKGIEYESRQVDLTKGEQTGAENMVRNPQGLVPQLMIDGLSLTQSLPIIEYLDQTRPGVPLIPEDPRERHKVRAIAAAVSMEMAPVMNLRVAKKAVAWSGDAKGMKDWMHEWMPMGLAAVEELISAGRDGGFCHCDTPTLADCCLIPQLYNARRWEVDLEPYPIIRAVEEHCGELNAFQQAHPEAVGAP